MPPLKEYIFKDKSDSLITISIKAYGIEDANTILAIITKYPSDFKLKN